MQINRSPNSNPSPANTLFPPANGQPDPHRAEPLGTVPTSPTVRVSQPQGQTPPPAATPGVVLKLSSPSNTPADSAVYSKGTVRGAPKIDLSNMSLENQLALGRQQGVFTKITLSKDGILLATPDVSRTPQAPEFVSSAVTAMRDFQEGIALLKEESPAVAHNSGGFFSGGLRSLQQAASKLNVFA